MDTLGEFVETLSVLALYCGVVSAVVALVKKITAKPAREPLKIALLSFLFSFHLLMASAIILPSQPSPPGSNNTPAASASVKPTPTSEITSSAEDSVAETQSKAPTPTLTPTPTPKPTQTPPPTPKPTPKPKYTGDKLETILAKYINTKKDAEKRKLMQSNPDELYGMIIDKMKNGFVSADKNAYSNKNFYQLCITLGNLYVELDNVSTNAEKMRKISSISENAIANYSKIDVLDRKYSYKLEEAFGTYSSSFEMKEFYIVKKLETKYEDTIMGRLQKELASLTDTPTEYLAANVESTYWGDTAGSTYYVVRPLKPFSASGTYHLGVIPDGTTTLVDSNGFEIPATVYLELDDTYITDMNADYEAYAACEAYSLDLDREIKTLLSL